MENIPDHPDIARALRTGYPYETEDIQPTCPICGHEAEYFYKDSCNEIVGCSWCLEEIDALEWMYEHKEEDE